ncbi:histidine kinase [Zoogloea sp.]|uniref:histidine kinase n=1 Tax=Zoogloea sp. TaxID=49181 RepID=UPI0035B20812
MNSLRHTLHHALHLSLPQARSDARSTHSGRHISLRLRVSLALTALAGVLVLAASLLWVRDARSAINEEVTAAHRVAAQWLTVAAQGTQSGDPAWSEHRLLRHLQAMGRIRAHELEVFQHNGARVYAAPASSYKSGRSAPEWFSQRMDPALPALRLQAGQLEVVLQPNASRAILDLWDDLTAAAGRALLALLGLFAGCWLAMDRALKPLGAVMAALERTGQGDFNTRLPEDGPPELAHLAQSFNGMTVRLEQAVAENTRLNHEQAFAQALAAHQEADRTAIARELHDELGQNITAVAALASAIAQRSPADQPIIAQSAQLIRESAARMQVDVRALLTRLRPPAVTGAEGLDDALATYLHSWQQHHPDIQLETRLATGRQPLPDALTLTALRIVQEGCTNIIRHARARRAQVATRLEGHELVLEICDDGCGLPAERKTGGFGLAGMAERVAELGGRLQLAAAQPTGTRILARLPLPQPEARLQEFRP